MSYNTIVHNQKPLITAQSILSRKYSKTNEEYHQMKIDLLIHSRPSHYTSAYRDHLIWDSPYTHFERYYQMSKALIKIPMKAIYYKNYLRFFSRPFIWDLRLDKIIQVYTNKKAKKFYKQVYGTLQKSRDEDMPNAPEGTNRIGKEELRTVFDTSARNVIDNQLTTDMLNGPEDFIVKNTEDFFSIETYNDFFVDIIKNDISKQKKNERKTNRLFFLKQTLTATKDEEKSKEKQIENEHPRSNGHLKSSYCNLYKCKPSTSKSTNDKQNDENEDKKANNTSNNKNEGKAFHLYSPKYQISTNYSEFKKYNFRTQSNSQSKSKSKQKSFASKSNAIERPKSQYTSYNKPSHMKNLMTQVNKPLITTVKGHISIEEHYTNPTLIKTKGNKNSYTNTSHIPKAKAKAKKSPKMNRNLLLNYLNICSNSRQTRQKYDPNHYFSMRNLSHEGTFPIQSPKATPHQSTQVFHLNTNSNIVANNKSSATSKVMVTTTKNITTLSNEHKKSIEAKCNKPSLKSNTSKDIYLSQKTANCSKNKNHKCNKQTLNGSTRTPTSSSVNGKGLFCRNQSHLNVFNEKGKNKNIAVIEKLIKGIKKNLYSNAIVNDISLTIKKNKSIKSTKHNDTSQTSSNTHQGHAHSKSPQLIEIGKNDSHTHLNAHNPNSNVNSNMINRYKYKSKPTQGMALDKHVKTFFSQRKGL